MPTRHPGTHPCLTLLALALAAGGLPAARAQTAPATTLPEVKVTADAVRQQAGTSTVLTQEDLERTGATGIADVIRYQPLVEAPGTVQGATRGASRYDRGGTTGYNIRGVEGNRVGLDVDGIEMPDAVGRSPFTNRAQDGTFGMGRDFIDPELYGTVDIQSGTTSARRSAGGIGGAVSFQSKSPEDYLRDGKPFHAAARLGYHQASSAWSEGATLAGQSGPLAVLLSYSRRDGKETRNNSDAVSSYPDDWHSDALLFKSAVRLDPAHRLELAADLYRKRSRSTFENWNGTATEVNGLSDQDARTRRNTVYASHLWTPGAGAWLDRLDTRVFVQTTEMHDVTDTVFTAGGAPARDLSRNHTRQTGLSSVADKRIGRHQLTFGLNYSVADNEHPFESTDAPATGAQPFPDTRTQRLGAFVEDSIEFQVGGKRLAVVPGLRVDRIAPEVRNTGRFANRLTQDELEALYGDVPATTIVSPSLAVLYDIQPALTAYAQWKRGGRAPTNAERFGYWNAGGATYALLGDRDLKKETSNAFELGLKGAPVDGVSFRGAVFLTRYKDFISYTRYTRPNDPERFVGVPDRLNILYQATNRDDASIYGTEFSMRLDHGTWTPAARGVYTTWAVGISKGSSKSDYAGDRKVDLDSVQPAKAIVGIGYDAPDKRWGLNLTGTFVRGKQAQATNRQSFSNNPGVDLTDSTVTLFDVPGYARFDLVGYWRIGKNVRVGGGIYNLTDKRYWAYASTRSLQPDSAQDQRQIALSTAPGRSFAVNLHVDF